MYLWLVALLGVKVAFNRKALAGLRQLYRQRMTRVSRKRKLATIVLSDSEEENPSQVKCACVTRLLAPQSQADTQFV